MLKYLNFQKFGCQIKIVGALLKVKISIEKIYIHIHILLYPQNNKVLSGKQKNKNYTHN